MSGLWQSHRDPDADLAPCQRCGKDVLLQADPPCPHGLVACPECSHGAVCVPCGLQAALDAVGDRQEPEPDPWGPLAAEGRAENDAFWQARGERRNEEESDG